MATVLKTNKWGILVLQLIGLWMINEFGYFLVHITNLPLPGNVLGMVILLLLLSTGIVKLNWVEAGSNFLIKYLAFFFIPISVGLINFGPLFLKSGLVIISVLVLSAIIGLIITGTASEILASRKEDDNHENHLKYRI